jgi:hypothetical protein
MADALSKGDFDRFRNTPGGTEFNGQPESVPLALLRWAARPTADDGLGDKLLQDLATRMAVLGYSC